MEIEIENMFILEEYRKYGIGTKLISEFKEYCSKNKIEELKVTASVKNKNTIEFYTKNVFDYIKTKSRLIGVKVYDKSYIY